MDISEAPAYGAWREQHLTDGHMPDVVSCRPPTFIFGIKRRERVHQGADAIIHGPANGREDIMKMVPKGNDIVSSLSIIVEYRVTFHDPVHAVRGSCFDRSVAWVA